MDFNSKDCYVLDGGLGVDIEKRGYPNILEDPLWSARLLHSDPQTLEDTHLDFLKNGADIIITASYQTSIPLLSQHLKVDGTKASELISESVAIAKRACAKYLEMVGRSSNEEGLPLIAGSVGPYGACLHDCSEYTGEYVEEVTKEELTVWHRPRITALLKGGADLLALETIPAQAEAEVLVELLEDFPGAKAFISFSCKDELHTCHGELFSDAVANVCHSPQVVAVGVNCTHPRFITPLLKSAAGVTDKPFVVYPNGKDHWDATTNSWIKTHPPLEKGFPPEFIQLWRSLGARIIGGCCFVNPTNIQGIRDTLHKDK